MEPRRIRVHWTKGCVLALLLPAAATAQPPGDGGAMDRQVKAGQHVEVSRSDGRRVNGRVLGVDATTLTLLVVERFDERAVTLDAATISTVRKSDSLLNGFLIGLGAGVAGGEAWIYSVCGPPGYDAECRAIATPIGWGVFGGGGAVLGTLIDKFSTKLLYRAPLSASGLRATRVGARALHVQPVFGDRVQGLRVSFTF